MPSPVQLRGRRVVLRSYRPTDAQVVWAAIEESRPSLARWVPDIGRRRSMAEVEHALAGLTHDQDRGARLIFGVWERGSGQFLGEVGLYEFDPGTGRGEVGYWIRRTASRQGYATQALSTLLTYAKAELGLHRFEAHIASDNAASRRLAERLGFRIAGRRAPAPRWDAQGQEVLIYALAERVRVSTQGHTAWASSENGSCMATADRELLHLRARPTRRSRLGQEAQR
jgi:RimJ/RimL family protein N-acetyltransferase